MRPERHNAVKVLLLLDVGGSMDEHIKRVEELFSRGHDRVQAPRVLLLPQLPLRRPVEGQPAPLSERTRPGTCCTSIGHDYKVIFVGDATMSPYEITHPAARSSISTRKPGGVWIQRFANTYPATVWLNPIPERQWEYSASTRVIRELLGGSMYPLTLGGLDDAMRELTRKKH